MRKHLDRYMMFTKRLKRRSRTTPPVLLSPCIGMRKERGHFFQVSCSKMGEVGKENIVGAWRKLHKHVEREANASIRTCVFTIFPHIRCLANLTTWRRRNIHREGGPFHSHTRVRHHCPLNLLFVPMEANVLPFSSYPLFMSYEDLSLLDITFIFSQTLHVPFSLHALSILESVLSVMKRHQRMLDTRYITGILGSPRGEFVLPFSRLGLW